MPLDPHIATFLAAQPAAAADASLDDIRRATELNLPMLHGPVQPVARVETFTVTASDGHPLRVRAYWPADTPRAAAPQPAIVFAHGGGWCLCSLELYDNPCRALANASRCVVLSVDYRLAPEHPYPVPLEDFYSAVLWAFAHASQLGIDPARIAVGGDSAGGNLAAAACLLARDRNGPAIAHQLLLYPALDDTLTTASYATYADGYYLTRDVMAFCWDTYLPGTGDGRPAWAAPMRATTLERLPPATILVCEYDPLRDEGEAYARRLRDAAVPAHDERLGGMVHGCIHMLGLTPAAASLFTRSGALIGAALSA
ncbi:alpha/beta hydrolase [Jeongeupia chitinilytica]|uniref:Esterase n=1 Tax=Jeongeupia chitinilytica TaxID=1041641 RepID=A0ABQ3H4Q5_9NEIS|nr:alpha/beta hydrolase [Jeongeupia chitinilytica]GHD67215.1 esterase [Jeongeupia chitinilytica]